MSPFGQRQAPVLPPARPDLAAGQTRPQVDAYEWNPQEVLIAMNAASRQLLDAHAELISHLEALTKPAAMETVVLTPATPTYESLVSQPFHSLSVLNPTAINIYFSLVGTAGALTRSLSAAPNCLITVPVGSNFVEVAANPTDLGANNAVVFVFRHATVQPAFVGKAA